MDGLASCTVVITFAPSETGDAGATLTLHYASGLGSESATRTLAGRGLSRAELVFDAGASFDFGTVAVGDLIEESFVITNLGQVSATAITPSAGPTAAFAYAGGSAPGSGGTCGPVLLPFASCTIVLSYHPSASGEVSSAVSLSYHDGVEAKAAALQLRGAATAAAFLVLSDGPTYDFGTIALSSARAHAFTLRNSGAVAATGMLPGSIDAPFELSGGYPGVGGDCGTTLAPAASCTLVVAFAPTENGGASSTLTLVYYDGAATQEATRALAGSGTTGAALSFEAAPTYDFGRQSVGASSEVALTLTNSGALATDGALESATTLSKGFAFKGGAFPGSGGTCGPALGAGASCTVVVTFAPAGNGPAKARMVVVDGVGGDPNHAELALEGLGVAPAALSISDGPSHDFGDRTVGTSTRRQLSISNKGGVTATAISVSGLTAPFAAVGGSCGATLDPSASCTISVDYQPAAPGEHADAVLLDFNDGAAMQRVTRELTGRALAPSILTISDGPTLEFGARATGSVSEATLTVTNSGASAATSLSAAALAGPFSFKGGAYPGTGGTCAEALAPGSGCLLVVAFAPTSVGLGSASLVIDYNDGAAAGRAERALSGTGLSPARLELAPAGALDFGTVVVGSMRLASYFVRNSGGVAATDVALSGVTGPFSASATTCAPALAPGASCDISVTFAAPVAFGAATGELVVEYGDGVATRTTRGVLKGVAAAPALLALSDGPTFDFGTVGLGAGAQHIFTVTNTGGVSPAGLAALSLTAPFAFSGGAFPGVGGSCGFGLAPGASCTVVVTFTPTVAGPATDNLALVYHDGARDTAAARALRAVATQQAALTISDYPQEYYQQYGLQPDGAVHDYGRSGVGRAAQHVFVVTNTGAVAATALSAATLDSGFSFAGGGSFPGQGGSCAGTLAVGASCTVAVAFSPPAAEPYTSQLALDYHDGVATVTATRALAGEGVTTAVLTLSDFEGRVRLGPAYDYGTQGIGSATSHAFYLENQGGAPATGLGARLSAAFALRGAGFPGAGGSCGATLAPGEACELIVDFEPTAEGLQSGALAVDYHDGVEAQVATRALAGAGTAQALVRVAEEHGSPLPVAFDFGVVGVGRQVVRRFVLFNVGAEKAEGVWANPSGAAFAVHQADPDPSGGGGSPDDPPACSGELEPRAKCSIWVAFAPTADGTQQGRVIATYFRGGGLIAASDTRALIGTGTTRAELLIVDYREREDAHRDPHDFGIVGLGRTGDRTFYVRNLGAQAATGLSAQGPGAPFSYPDGYPGTLGPAAGAASCGTTVPAGATCAIVLRFTPSASEGSNDAITLEYHDGAELRSARREVTGRGTARAFLRVADYSDGWPSGSRPYDYGLRGQALDHTFYVINDGALAATLSDAGLLAGAFNWTGGSFPGTGGTCGAATLAAGASCTVVVTFTPSGEEAQTGRLGLRYVDAGGEQLAERALAGTATTAPVVQLHSWAGQEEQHGGFDFGLAGKPREQSFFVANLGGSSASITGATLTGSAFAFKGGVFPGSGGTCALNGSVAAGARCEVVVTFDPRFRDSGVTTGLLEVAWTPAAGTGPGGLSRLALAGLVTGRPAIVVRAFPGESDLARPIDLGAVAAAPDGSSTRTQTLYVANLGATDLDDLAPVATAPAGPAIRYLGGAFPGTGGSCSAALPASSTDHCTIVLELAPLAAAVISDAITLGGTDLGGGAISFTRSLVGRGL
ncbi:MAG: choice-of-anchor D domain-containing protein [Proteobacteria bacterium]|nr:choice-of-anchor D domain-containing protein [Pseudomonadota bacterium]